MDETVSPYSPWSLQALEARLGLARLSASVNLARPQLGLQSIEFDGRSVPGGLLRVHRIGDDASRAVTSSANAWPLEVGDAYIRGSDLVVTYRPSDEWPYSPQVYWRANGAADPQSGVASISLVVSMQTHLLDTWPQIGIWSRLASEELLYVSVDENQRVRSDRISAAQTLKPNSAACCIVHRLKDAALSCLEIMPGSDFQQVRVERNGSGESCVEWAIFSEFLEKGVIRKARLQCAFTPRERDLETAIACCNAMEHGELPLTT